MIYRTRFAPSPTGPLHLGHALSALTGLERANTRDGEFLLRIEDTDQSRVRPEWESLIYEDLAWLGIEWPKPVRRQSEHTAAYAQAIDTLAKLGLVYPCSCTRADIRAASQTDHIGPDGLVYPGTCRNRPYASRLPGDALRLNVAETLAHLNIASLTTEETGPSGPLSVSANTLIETTGDFVLWRRSDDPAYHLAVVVDDALQGITEVVRGFDLYEATPLQILLQKALGLPTPLYHHHRLITDEAGKRLAKRDDSKSLLSYRNAGATPSDILDLIQPFPG
ncbi:MAG: tRNA glutamyl-Q(34) synthetase GluQRS [Pseudomonadota bacterium]